MADENQLIEETTEDIVSTPETTTEEVQPETVETPQEDTTPTISPEEFLANFDWQNYEEGIEAVEDVKLKRFLSGKSILNTYYSILLEAD